MLSKRQVKITDPYLHILWVRLNSAKQGHCVGIESPRDSFDDEVAHDVAHEIAVHFPVYYLRMLVGLFDCFARMIQRLDKHEGIARTVVAQLKATLHQLTHQFLLRDKI